MSLNKKSSTTYLFKSKKKKNSASCSPQKNPVYGEKFGPWKNKIDGETLFRAGTLERDDFKIQAFYPPVQPGSRLYLTE